MIYEIEPFDNFFFRSAAPFEAGGETTVSQSQMQPLPSTYAGAFRVLTKDPVHSARSIKIGYSGFMIGDIFYFPMPLDLYALEPRANEDWRLSCKFLEEAPFSNFPFSKILRAKDAPKNKKHPLLYLSEQMLYHYLQNDAQTLHGIDVHTKVIKERRLGIAIDYAAGTSKDKHIYEISCVRPKLHSELKLAVEVEAELVKESGVIKLGGEEKKAQFQQASRQLELLPFVHDSKYFKLYLATPAIFKHGWLPGWIDEETMTGVFAFRKKRIKVKLLCACVGRSIPCGGFGKAPDQAGQYRPREMRYAVPAGSVYYFELLEGTIHDAMKLFHGKCVSEYRENMGFDYQLFTRSRYCTRGFGYAFVGTLNQTQEEFLNV